MQVMKQTGKNQKYQIFSKKLKQMPVLNSYNFGTFIMLVYAANIGGALILKDSVQYSTC